MRLLYSRKPLFWSFYVYLWEVACWVSIIIIQSNRVCSPHNIPHWGFQLILLFIGIFELTIALSSKCSQVDLDLSVFQPVHPFLNDLVSPLGMVYKLLWKVIGFILSKIGWLCHKDCREIMGKYNYLIFYLKNNRQTNYVAGIETVCYLYPS